MELLGTHILVSFQIGLECLSRVAFPLNLRKVSERENRRREISIIFYVITASQTTQLLTIKIF